MSTADKDAGTRRKKNEPAHEYESLKRGEPGPAGGGEAPLTEEEQLDEALDETFPASDPVSPSRIDGPIKTG